MKEFFSLLKADLYRALFSLNFVISIASVMLVMFISCSGFITDTANAIYLLGHALTGSGSTLFILCIAPVLPYGMSFASDMEDKALPFWIIRAGTKRYAVSKFISAVIAGLLSVAISIVALPLIMSLFFPMYNDISTENSYAALLKNNRPGMYILAIAAHYSLSAALFSGTAVAVSSFVPKKFISVSVPVVIYFVLMRLTDLTGLPLYLKASFLVQGIYPDVSPVAAFMYKLIPVACVLSILLIISVRQIRKRVETL